MKKSGLIAAVALAFSFGHFPAPESMALADRQQEPFEQSVLSPPPKKEIYQERLQCLGTPTVSLRETLNKFLEPGYERVSLMPLGAGNQFVCYEGAVDAQRVSAR